MSPHTVIAYFFMVANIINAIFIHYWPGVIVFSVLSIFGGVRGFMEEGDFWGLMSAFIGLIFIFASIVLLLNV